MDYCLHFFKDKQLTTALTDFRTLPRKVVLMVKNLPVNEGDARDTGSIPGLGRSPGKGNGNPFQYSCLENSMDRGAWQATVHGAAKSGTRLSDWTHTRTRVNNEVLQFSSVAQSCPTPFDPMDCSTPDFPVHHQLLELAQTHVHRVGDASNHLILCCPLLLPHSISPSIRVFSNESVLHIRLPKYWSLSFSISPSNEHSGLMSFRTDWSDLLAVQVTLKSLLQHHSSKASIL